MTETQIVRQLDSLDEKGLQSVADLLDYNAAMGLYEQLQRRLLEDGAPIKGAFDD